MLQYTSWFLYIKISVRTKVDLTNLHVMRAASMLYLQILGPLSTLSQHMVTIHHVWCGDNGVLVSSLSWTYVLRAETLPYYIHTVLQHIYNYDEPFPEHGSLMNQCWPTYREKITPGLPAIIATRLSGAWRAKKGSEINQFEIKML